MLHPPITWCRIVIKKTSVPPLLPIVNSTQSRIQVLLKEKKKKKNADCWGRKQIPKCIPTVLTSVAMLGHLGPSLPPVSYTAAVTASRSTPTPHTYRVRGELGLVDAAVKHRVHAGPGGLDRHALPHAVPAARPAGVDQEALGAVLVQLLLEQVGIPGGTYKRCNVFWRSRWATTGRKQTSTFSEVSTTMLYLSLIHI